MRAITFAWGWLYIALAKRLEASCHKVGISLEVVSLEGSPPSRQRAWAARASALARLLRDGRPVLYLDADSVVRGPVSLPAEASGADFAAVRHNDRYWRLGVLSIEPTARARQVLERFAWRLEVEDFENDEPIFADVVRELGAHVYDLPPEFNWREAWNDRGRWGNVRPVLEGNA